MDINPYTLQTQCYVYIYHIRSQPHFVCTYENIKPKQQKLRIMQCTNYSYIFTPSFISFISLSFFFIGHVPAWIISPK